MLNELYVDHFKWQQFFTPFEFSSPQLLFERYTLDE